MARSVGAVGTARRGGGDRAAPGESATDDAAWYAVSMRQPFAHEALLSVDAATDERAPGAAVTVGLCGSREHEPPCPLAPHHTRAERFDGELRVRTLFAAEPAEEDRVRGLIDAALAGGSTDDPDGVRHSWRLTTSGPSPVHPDEQEHAARLAGG